jgi:hypothetical protein
MTSKGPGWSTDFVEDLVRLQAEAAGDDFYLDFGGAAEACGIRSTGLGAGPPSAPATASRGG